jgi:ribosomal protein L29
MKKLFVLLMILGCTLTPVSSQERPTEQAASEEAEKAKAERQKNAYRLLDQVIDEAQSLRVVENRVRVQIVAGDLLWDNNQGRARSLLTMAAEGVAELNRAQQQNTNNNRRNAPPNNNNRRAFQLRQELVLAAARHDAQLAYQLLASTKPLVQNAVPTDPRNARFQPNALNAEDSLEQMLLGRIASLDPKLAAQNAEQLMDKGQFPRSMAEVIHQLNKQDPEAAAKLTDKTVKKLQTANLLTNAEAGFLIQQFLMGGPRLAENAAGQRSGGRPALLEQGAYVELLGTVVDLALKAMPPTPARRPAQPGVRSGVNAVGPGGGPPQPTEAQIEQNGARRFLATLQNALPVIDQYLPGKSAAVRQKLAEAGMPTNPPVNVQYPVLQGNATSDALIQAAVTAPPQMQPRLYQQAAYKALEEGNADRARQIATEHLSDKAREILIQQVTFREMAQKGDTTRLDEIRQTIARLQTDEEKLNAIVQIAQEAEKINPKLAAQLLEDAKQITSRRATGYDQFGQQLRVAHAFATIDPARSFEVLDPAISQLNELLAAAAVLNGFEINMFRDGEMMLQSETGLSSMITRFGFELAVLARSDFERSETLAGRFQFAEPRIMARLAIVQGVLDPRRQSTVTPVFRN